MSDPKFVENEHTYLIITKEPVTKSSDASDHLLLTLNSRLFFTTLNDADRIVTEMYKVPGVKEVSLQVCGTLPQSRKSKGDIGLCNLSGSVTKRRRDLKGVEITAVYDQWLPYCKIGKNGQLIGGIMPEILDTMSKNLNFTAKYE